MEKRNLVVSGCAGALASALSFGGGPANAEYAWAEWDYAGGHAYASVSPSEISTLCGEGYDNFQAQVHVTSVTGWEQDGPYYDNSDCPPENSTIWLHAAHPWGTTRCAALAGRYEDNMTMIDGAGPNEEYCTMSS